MLMKCKNCGVENTNDAKFCRGCGQELLIYDNPMDKWPNHGFQPTSLVSLKQYKSISVFFFKLFRFISWGAGLFVSFFASNIYGFFVYDTEYDGYISHRNYLFDLRIGSSDFFGCLFSGFFVFIVAFLITILLYKRCPKKRHEAILKKDVDYIQGTSFSSKTYLFFIKDNLWGCYNMKNFSIQIPAAYEFLEWREYGRLLNGKKDNKSIIIDINGQPLK